MSNTKSPDSDASNPDVGDTDQVSPTAVSATSTRRNRLILGGVAAIVIVADQVTKVWAASALEGGRTIDLFWTARFRLIRNFGSAFGLGSSLGRWLAVLIIGVVIAVLLYARKIDDGRMQVLFGGIVGGAIGNIIDRIVRAEDGFLSGGVVDFIDFQWWPVFNIADIAVVLSALGLLLLSLREPT